MGNKYRLLIVLYLVLATNYIQTSLLKSDYDYIQQWLNDCYTASEGGKDPIECKDRSIFKDNEFRDKVIASSVIDEDLDAFLMLRYASSDNSVADEAKTIPGKLVSNIQDTSSIQDPSAWRILSQNLSRNIDLELITLENYEKMHNAFKKYTKEHPYNKSKVISAQNDETSTESSETNNEANNIAGYAATILRIFEGKLGPLKSR